MINYEKAQKLTIERVEHMGVRGYRLTNGDVFTVDSRRLFDVFTMNNSCYFFCPMRKYKKSIWYKPSTWFRELWEIKYIEIQ